MAQLKNSEIMFNLCVAPTCSFQSFPPQDKGVVCSSFKAVSYSRTFGIPAQGNFSITEFLFSLRITSNMYLKLNHISLQGHDWHRSIIILLYLSGTWSHYE